MSEIDRRKFLEAATSRLAAAAIAPALLRHAEAFSARRMERARGATHTIAMMEDVNNV